MASSSRTDAGLVTTILCRVVLESGGDGRVAKAKIIADMVIFGVGDFGGS